MPTRGDSILDVILTSAPVVTSVSFLPLFAIADHSVVAFEAHIPLLKHRDLPLPNIIKANYSGLVCYFGSVDWWAAFQGYQNIDDLYKRFCHVVYSGVSSHVHFQSTKVPVKHGPMHISILMVQKHFSLIHPKIPFHIHNTIRYVRNCIII